jgi:wyosine [tRNA(Phe)-imidazoG37] synthetase (radical SAM superfamily)
MNYVFGPVPSRRLGRSLGIDPIPLKTCNWNCVYCQLGRSVPLINERREYIPRQDILDEIREALDVYPDDAIDWITFVGSGETTLYSQLGWLIDQLKLVTPLPVAVITNGSLLYRPEVRQELLAADAVLPTLDAGTPGLYRHINRPHPESTFDRLLGGLIDFRRVYRGKLWVEVMLVHGLNDIPVALWSLAEALKLVQPDCVHINLPARPPAETWVQPPDREGLVQAIAILGSIAEVVHPAEGDFDLSGCANPVDAVIGIITRHPMRDDELRRALGKFVPGQVDEIITQVAASGQAQIIERYGVRFWIAAQAHFPNEDQSKRTKPGSGRGNHQGRGGWK